MEVTKIPLEDIPQFSSRDQAYVQEVESLQPFYKYPVRLESFKSVIEDKSQNPVDRDLLLKALKSQYSKLEIGDQVEANIELLAKENCFTVCTAHQPSLFTGPLYYIYKILSTIRLAEILNETYSDYHFVPVFVSGAEDHDFEEINHTQLFGKPVNWESGEQGAVGSMRTSKLSTALTNLKELLGNSPFANEVFQKIEKAYTGNDTYGPATIELVHELFKPQGLVVIDMSATVLKRAAIPLFKEELLQQSSAPLVKKQIAALNAAGFNAQASPRDINLFYLRDQLRGRIVLEGEMYQVLNSNFSFTKDALKEELQSHPERFSPNVVLRPLYQELILPNLAYIGGGGELAYWLERKTQFEHFGFNFPMLIRRTSALILNGGAQKKMKKLGLEVSQLFEDEDALIKQYVHQIATTNLSLQNQKETLKSIFDSIDQLAKTVDPTLSNTVQAEHARQLKGIENLESKFVKAEKRKSEVALNQLSKLKEQLFPSRSLQERKENFLGYYTNYGEGFLEDLKEHMNPLDKKFVVIKV